jgi:hypothetical protein
MKFFNLSHICKINLLHQMINNDRKMSCLKKWRPISWYLLVYHLEFIVWAANHYNYVLVMKSTYYKNSSFLFRKICPIFYQCEKHHSFEMNSDRRPVKALRLVISEPDLSHNSCVLHDELNGQALPFCPWLTSHRWTDTLCDRRYLANQSDHR